MKVRLLNDGTYDELSHIEFPVEVEAEFCFSLGSPLVSVNAKELLRLGAVNWDMDDGDLTFIVGTECELVEN